MTLNCQHFVTTSASLHKRGNGYSYYRMFNVYYNNLRLFLSEQNDILDLNVLKFSDKQKVGGQPHNPTTISAIRADKR